MSEPAKKRQKTTKEASDEPPKTLTAALSDASRELSAPLEKDKAVPLRAYFDASKDATLQTLVIIAHGAGGNHNSPDIVATAEGLRARLPQEEAGVVAFTATTTSLLNRVKQIAAVLTWAAKQFPLVKKIYLVGRSMGCRVAAKAALELDKANKIAGLIFCSYPLVPGDRFASSSKPKKDTGKPDERKSLLLDVAKARPGLPLLFIAGTADPMLPPTQLNEALGEMQEVAGQDKMSVTVANCTDADHGLSVKGKGGAARTRELQAEFIKTIAAWINKKPEHETGIHKSSLSF